MFKTIKIFIIVAMIANIYSCLVPLGFPGEAFATKKSLREEGKTPDKVRERKKSPPHAPTKIAPMAASDFYKELKGCWTLGVYVSLPMSGWNEINYEMNGDSTYTMYQLITPIGQKGTIGVDMSTSIDGYVYMTLSTFRSQGRFKVTLNSNSYSIKAIYFEPGSSSSISPNQIKPYTAACNLGVTYGSK